MDDSSQGAWVHPQVTINLAQWASPKFAVLVSKWIFEWMSGNISGGKNLPYHLPRYMINRTEIPHTHFFDIALRKVMFEALNYLGASSFSYYHIS